ncbi:ABC transporter [Thermincola ferriacetica]|uniref:ABC transporter n=1 Tax=Thermincola ferriacetica TaxID=281456 RepID=A0A0L6W4Y4_9FIRM|nr:ATP-binding cassette domain-containing protein [Thermincola ferriacetica]KNZ70413.1 ABC transporter [Thermincola ferriacetica]
MLEIKNLSLTVEGDKGQVQILKDINLTLEDNRLYVFTGPNGGGKSSLAKAIMGIYRPTSGKILFNGQDITDLSVYERARLGIGYAFQQPPRFKGITVGELLQIAAGRDIKGCSYLADVGLCAHDYVDREMDASLSGGELKRIEIATLLARNLKVAVYDEPEAGIDLWSFSKLTETFKNVHTKYDTTLVIISHQERILSLADEIILIADGTVKEKGSKDELWPLMMNDIGFTYFRDCTERDENVDECIR